METAASSSGSSMTLSEKKKRLKGIKGDISGIDSELADIQTKLDRLCKKKMILEKEKKNLESEANHLELVCNMPDLNLKRSDFKWSLKIHELKTSKFGIKSFRPYQEEVINATMSKRDAILVMPTGGGKSLCFQLPALLSEGFTLVVSPLVSLMEDQTMALQAIGIPATLLSASTSRDHLKTVHQEMIQPKAQLKLLYVTPEKIVKSKRFMAQLQKAYEKGRLSRIAIDEVHCCSQWGHDFRPDYKVLGILKRQFPQSPILGLTATASSSVLEDVKHILNIPGCDVFRASYNRANLYYEVRPKPTGKEFTIKLVAMLKGEFANQSGIIYCFSRKDTETLAEDLRSQGIVAAAYHASIEPSERSQTHRNWKNGHIQVVVATTAFGMGIDKPDVRFVIHHSLSKSMENYYQESGRAGRNDEQAKCILFFGFVDVFRQSTMVVMEQTGLTKLYQMVAYCISRGRCRRASLAEHFDETWDKSVECNRMCDACKKLLTVDDFDVSNILKTILRVLEESATKEQRLTGLKMIDQLSKTSNQKAYTKMSKFDFGHIILNLLLEGHLKEDFHFTAYSTISYICPGPKANHLGSKITVPMSSSANSGGQSLKTDSHKGQLKAQDDDDIVIIDDADDGVDDKYAASSKLQRDGTNKSNTKKGSKSVGQRSRVTVQRSQVTRENQISSGKSKGKGRSSECATSPKKEEIGIERKASKGIKRKEDVKDPVSSVRKEDFKIIENPKKKRNISDGDTLFNRCSDKKKVEGRGEDKPVTPSKGGGKGDVLGSNVKTKLIKRKVPTDVIDLCGDTSDTRGHKKKRKEDVNDSELSSGCNNSLGMAKKTQSVKEKCYPSSGSVRRGKRSEGKSAHAETNLHNLPSNQNSKSDLDGRKESGGFTTRIDESRKTVDSMQDAINTSIKGIGKNVRRKLERISDISREENEETSSGIDESSDRGGEMGGEMDAVDVKESHDRSCDVSADISINSSGSISDLASVYMKQLSSLVKDGGDVDNVSPGQDVKKMKCSKTTNNKDSSNDAIPSPINDKSPLSIHGQQTNGKSSLSKSSKSNRKNDGSYQQTVDKSESTNFQNSGINRETSKATRGKHGCKIVSDKFSSLTEYDNSKISRDDDDDLYHEESELAELATVYSEQLSSLERRYSEEDCDSL